MATATLDRPATRPMNLRTLPDGVRPTDGIVTVLDVTFSTPGAWRVRVPGGTRTTLLAYSVAREVRPDRPIPPGARAFIVPRWKHDQLAREINEPE